MGLLGALSTEGYRSILKAVQGDSTAFEIALRRKKREMPSFKTNAKASIEAK
jgi:hypothetical protein